MRWLVKLDLERMRQNLELTTGTPKTEEDVLRLLGAMKIRRRDDDDWFLADQSALHIFLDGEMLEKRAAE
jgi:hypothetical protein